ncbi:MAG: hypothetical protein ACLT98_09285 [Eggerthellaceae bacterium]
MLMLSSTTSSPPGSPADHSTQDMIIGLYYLTAVRGFPGRPRVRRLTRSTPTMLAPT